MGECAAAVGCDCGRVIVGGHVVGRGRDEFFCGRDGFFCGRDGFVFVITAICRFWDASKFKVFVKFA